MVVKEGDQHHLHLQSLLAGFLWSWQRCTFPLTTLSLCLRIILKNLWLVSHDDLFQEFVVCFQLLKDILALIYLMSFCSWVKSFDTILAHIFCMSKVSTKMVQIVSLSIPSLLAMMWMVKQRSLQTNCCTFMMLALVVEVQGLPNFGSSSTSSLPSTNCLCHSKTFVLDMKESP